MARLMPAKTASAINRFGFWFSWFSSFQFFLGFNDRPRAFQICVACGSGCSAFQAFGLLILHVVKAWVRPMIGTRTALGNLSRNLAWLLLQWNRHDKAGLFPAICTQRQRFEKLLKDLAELAVIQI